MSGQGDAARPLITDTVTMGNDTVLSGFTVEPPATRTGILVENSGDVQVTFNTVRTTDALTSILVDNERVVSGTVIFSDNDINAVGTGETSLAGIQATSNSPIIFSSNTIDLNGNIPDSHSSFSGLWARGISIISEGPITINDNDINVTTIGFSYVEGIRTSGGPTTLSSNRVVINVNTGPSYRPFAAGISSSSNNSIAIVDNNLDMIATGSFYGLSGISSSGESITTSNNSVVVDAGGSSYLTGISSSSRGANTISGNVVTVTEGSFVVTGIRSSGSSTLISDNSVTAISNSHSITGIQSSGGPTVISDNTVTVAGSAYVTGISSGDFTVISVLGNMITVSEYTPPSYWPKPVGVRLHTISGISPTQCILLSNNNSQTLGGGFGYIFFNEGDGILQIVDSTPSFADIQASNIGTFSFEPNISSFTNVAACPQN